MTPGPGIELGTHWWEAVLSPLHHPCSTIGVELQQFYPLPVENQLIFSIRFLFSCAHWSGPWMSQTKVLCVIYSGLTQMRYCAGTQDKIRHM